VIASMTVGKDVSALFPDVANCMQTDNLELKKLVYLYLVRPVSDLPEQILYFRPFLPFYQMVIVYFTKPYFKTANILPLI
jgi:hypothetical protein